jgi:type IV pilus assembly protein PilN
MIRINLLPTERVIKVQGVKSQFFVGIFLVAMAVLAMAILFSGLNDKIKGLKEEIAKAEKEKSHLKNIEKENEEVRKKNDSLKDRLDTITQLEKGRSVPIQVYDSLATILDTPKSKIFVWLSLLNYDGSNLVIQGTAFTNPDISRFMKALDASPQFKNVELEQVRKVETAKGAEAGVYEFNIKATLEQPDLPVVKKEEPKPKAPAKKSNPED